MGVDRHQERSARQRRATIDTLKEPLVTMRRSMGSIMRLHGHSGLARRPLSGKNEGRLKLAVARGEPPAAALPPRPNEKAGAHRLSAGVGLVLL